MNFMDQMNDGKKVLTWFLIGAGILAVIIFVWYLGRNSVGPYGQQTWLGGGAPPSTTRHAVPSNIAVPDIGSSVPSNVAKPQIVAVALTGSSASFRSFSITVSGNKFTPDTVIVKAGDRVSLSIKAVDKDYDFTQPDYGLSSPLPKGKTTKVEFQATAADKYTFYCKICGGPSSGPVGYVTVVK